MLLTLNVQPLCFSHLARFLVAQDRVDFAKCLELFCGSLIRALVRVALLREPVVCSPYVLQRGFAINPKDGVPVRRPEMLCESFSQRHHFCFRFIWRGVLSGSFLAHEQTQLALRYSSQNQAGQDGLAQKGSFELFLLSAVFWL
jgi:hypothetical protein